MKLNPQQQAAVKYLGGPLLVLAGAGSGKTGVITQKIKHLIVNVGYLPHTVAAITFTNKAATEMQERVAKMLPKSQTRGLTICTFHSLGMKILREEANHIGYKKNFSILDSTDSSSRWNPRATLGYAWGSGDDGKGTDNSHHQTGMQTNKSEMGAVYDFKTYGTVLNPALTNIHVLTAAVGIAPMKDSSLDLVYHHYRQDKLGALSKTALNPEADLQNRRTLGNGFDLVWGWTPGPAWRVQAYAGVFMPSGRFRASNDAGAGKSANAYAVGIDIRYYPGR